MIKIKSFLLAFIALFLTVFAIPLSVSAQEIREYMDLQIHPTMHMVYGFFGNSLEFYDENHPPKISHKHQFKNVIYANHLLHNKGARIFVNGALTKEFEKSERNARQLILDQIEAVNAFALNNAADVVVARNPQEVRNYVHNTNKTIIIHSIEGGKNLIKSQDDAFFWAQQGVAYITLVHLVDSEFGSAAIKPGFFPALINFWGLFKKKKNRGLTEQGKQAILWLANAGIMTDLTHMSDLTRTDALNWMELHKIPPLVTHDSFKPIQNHPRGVPAEQVLQIYRNGGLMSLPISGESLHPHKTNSEYREKLNALPHYCPGTIDDYQFTYEALRTHIEQNTEMIFGEGFNSFEELTENEKVNLAIGFQSDFNGWLNHHGPRYGKKGCYEIKPGVIYEPVELEGLAHPGLLNSHWKVLEREEVDLAPVKRASEKFLQMWELFLSRKGSFTTIESEN